MTKKDFKLYTSADKKVYTRSRGATIYEALDRLCNLTQATPEQRKFLYSLNIK